MNREKGSLLLLTTSHGVTDFYGGFLGPLLPGLCVRLGISTLEGSLLVMVYLLLMNFPQPILGHFMQPYWNRTFIWIGPILASLVCLMGAIHSPLLLGIVFAVAALGTAAYHPEAVSKAHGLFTGRDHSAMSLMFLGGYAGNALGKVAGAGTVALAWKLTRSSGFGEAVAEGEAFQALLVWLPVGLLFGILLWVNRERFNLETPPPDPGAADRPGPVRGEKRHLSILLACATMVTTTLTLFGMFLPFYYKETMTDYLFFSGVATFLYGFSGSLASVFIARAAERSGPERVLRWVLVPAAPLLFTLTFIPPWSTLLVLPFAGASCAGLFPVLVSLSQRFQRIRAGLSAGAMVGVTWGIGALFLPFGGALVDSIGPTRLLRFASLLPIVTLGLIFVLLHRGLPGESRRGETGREIG